MINCFAFFTLMSCFCLESKYYLKFEINLHREPRSKNDVLDESNYFLPVSSTGLSQDFDLPAATIKLSSF